MIIIGISGKMRSGKDECCNAILNRCAELKLTCKRLAFADALKTDICRMCMVTPEYLEENKRMFRLMMQGYGTDFKREQNPNYWINRWHDSLIENLNIDVIVTPDVRFKNEFIVIKNLKGFLFRIKREMSEINYPDAGCLSHQSEIDLSRVKDSDFDVIIDNKGTLENFHDEVKLKLEMYKILCIIQKTAQR